MPPLPDGREWTSGLNLVEGTIVICDNQNYIVNDGKSHISQPGWEPDLSSDLFAAIDEDYAPWEQPNSRHDGMSTIQLAEEFGCHRTTVSGILKKAGIAVTNGKSHLLDAEDVIAMYNDKLSIAEIAKKYGIGKNVVNRYLRANGISIRMK
jgi:AraC-like DNA-binding protein